MAKTPNLRIPNTRPFLENLFKNIFFIIAQGTWNNFSFGGNIIFNPKKAVQVQVKPNFFGSKMLVWTPPRCVPNLESVAQV